MLIKSKKDARILADEISKTVHGGGFRDSKISMITGGGTKIWEEDGVFYEYSQGPRWCDQAPTTIGDIENATEWIWYHRKDINAALRENIFWY